MSEIGKGFRRGAKALLDFSTQQRLLEREKAQKLTEKQDADTRAAMLKLTALNTPAGIAATRGILGDTFDPSQELEYRRLSTLLKAPNVKDQYDVLNPALASAGFKGRFAPTDYDVARTDTERVRKARIEQQRKDDEATNVLRRDKITKDIEVSKAHLAEITGKLYEEVIAGRANPKKVLEQVDVIDRIAKGYAEHLDKIKKMPDFKKINPKYEDEYEELDEKGKLNFAFSHPDLHLTNERYAGQVEGLLKSQNEALAVRSRLLDAMLDKSRDAQQLDQASGGQIAGNAGENVKRQMAMELIRRNYPQLYAQLIAEQNRQAQASIPNIDVSGFVQTKNGKHAIGPTQSPIRQSLPKLEW